MTWVANSTHDGVHCKTWGICLSKYLVLIQSSRIITEVGKKSWRRFKMGPEIGQREVNRRRQDPGANGRAAFPDGGASAAMGDEDELAA
jgi:hypothetical protein